MPDAAKTPYDRRALMLHAYRLLSSESEHACGPDSLWEWNNPWMQHLVWHARTFRRRVVQRYFVTWQALDAANTHLWDTAYAPHACYAPWPTWHAWLLEYRELLVSIREVYEAHHGPRRTSGCR